MKKIILLVLVVVMIYLAGCTAVKSTVDSTQTTIANLNKQAGICDEKSEWRNNILVICPETTAATPGNVTPTQTGR